MRVVARISGGWEQALTRRGLVHSEAHEERVFEPVGSERPQPLRARLIAASNKPLGPEVEAGRFRADLHDRLNAVGLCLPPLRQRPGVVTRLAQKFLR